MNLQGTIIHVFDLQEIETKSGTPFRKRPIVIKTDGEYPQEVKIEVTGKAIESIQPVGTTVDCHLDIRGRGYDKKDGSGRDWFTSVNCWRIDKVVASAPLEEDAPF